MQLAPGYTRPEHPIGSHLRKAHNVHTAGVAASAPIPGAAAGAAEADVVHAERVAKHTGSHTVPAGDGAAVLVRLRWDNGYSWVHSKTLVRRVDVLLPGNHPEPGPEPDLAETWAANRTRHLDTFLLPK
jgi:hypothetical protein